ncbi:MAG: hypothetical protein HKN44_11270 [Ilumatobacter sp.]|nr:hypothetical protein [Ilumatobacter sp.]
MNDPTKPAGERVEDIVEGIVTEASPYEESTTEGGTDEAGRDGEDALDDDAPFTT